VSEELLGLSLLVLVGKVLGDLTERAGYGRLVGEITGGALLGPYVTRDVFRSQAGPCWGPTP